MTSHSKKHKRFYHFEKEVVRPHDIFYAEHFGFDGKKVGHYFYCIYAQEVDVNNELFRDITGLLITTKEAVGYSVKIQINNKDAYVCCDEEVRFISEVGKVHLKYFKPTKEEKKEVIRCYKSFNKEKNRQMRKGLGRRANN